MKHVFTFALLFFALTAFSQKYFTKQGYVKFFSQAPLENIEADNTQALCIIDLEEGEIISKILMNSFQFDKKLMQEHFNENYVESEKYPQAVLRAKIANMDQVSLTSDTKQSVILEGKLTLHGVTNDVSIPGSFIFNKKSYQVNSTFVIKPEDYNIKIPKAVKENIAKEIEVTVKFELEELNK